MYQQKLPTAPGRVHAWGSHAQESLNMNHEKGDIAVLRQFVSVWENIEMALRAGQDLCWPVLGRQSVWGTSGGSHIWFQNGVE